MNFWKEAFVDILPVIEKAAPIIATAIGSPMAGTASVALSVLAKVFSQQQWDIPGIVHAVTNDPEAESKLRSAQPMFQQHMLDEWRKYLPQKLTIIAEWDKSTS